MTDYTIRVEVHPMTQPKPLGFGVFADGRVVAHLSVEQLRAALARFDELNAARVTSHSAGDERAS